MAAGQGGAPGAGGTQDTRVARIEEGVAGLQTVTAGNSLYDANWPTYPMTLATATTATGVANGEVQYTATPYYGGTIGNNIKVQYVTGTGALSVAVSGYTVTVTLASGGSTANAIAAAVNGALEGSTGGGGYVQQGTQDLVTAVAQGTGAGVVTAAYGPLSLAGATAAEFNTFDAGLAAGVEPGRAIAQVDTQWENSGLDPWAALKAADPTKW